MVQTKARPLNESLSFFEKRFRLSNVDWVATELFTGDVTVPLIALPVSPFAHGSVVESFLCGRAWLHDRRHESHEIRLRSNEEPFSLQG